MLLKYDIKRSNPVFFYLMHINSIDSYKAFGNIQFLQKKNYPGRREGYMPALLMPKADTSSAYLMTHN